MKIFVLLLVTSHALAQDDGYAEGDSDGGPGGDSHGQGPAQPAASILHHHQELADDGTFKYAFSADNGLQQKEAFHPDGSRTGAYSYVDPSGETVVVHYRADKFGFHVLDGSSIPTTPPMAGRSSAQENQNSEDDHPSHGQETSSYEVEEPDGESSSSAGGDPAAAAGGNPSASPPASISRPFGFEMSHAPPGLHNRFYRSAAQELFSEPIVVEQSDLDSIAAEDLSGAASSNGPIGLSGYVPVYQGRSSDTGYKSPFASLARQIQYPVRGKAEREVENVPAEDDGNREAAASGDNGDYSLHVGKYDDGSYPQHAAKYDDGSYHHHAVKYDDGSYNKYARMYGDGQEGAGNSDHGRGEYEAKSVRQPAEEEVAGDY